MRLSSCNTTKFQFVCENDIIKKVNYKDLEYRCMVRTEDACEIIQLALQNGIKVYVDGGWGVDALLGRETRIHNDIDLFV